jgi:hypothetical protein
MSRLVSTASAWNLAAKRRAFRDVAAYLAASESVSLCSLRLQLLAWQLFTHYGRCVRA